MIEFKTGSLLDAEEQFIAHACNATAIQAGGLAHYLFQRFDYANIYSLRQHPHKPAKHEFPGNIIVRGNGLREDRRLIVNMVCQYHPGPPHKDHPVLDSSSIRKGYFRMCLTKIAAMQNLQSVAFPMHICCGVSQGSWIDYLGLLEEFARLVKIKNNTRVVIYRGE